MLAGLRSFFGWFFGGLSAPGIGGQGTSGLCIEDFRVYPALGATLRVYAALDAGASVYPAVAGVASNRAALQGDGKVYPAMGGSVTVGCTC